MAVTYKPKEGPQQAKAAPAPRRAARPGLPLALAGGLAGGGGAHVAPGIAAPDLADAARDARARRDAVPDPPPQGGASTAADPAPTDAAPTPEALADSAPVPAPEAAEAAPAAPAPPAAAQSDRRATPMAPGPAPRRAPSARVKPPVLPRVDIPDRAGIRAPVVPPPPAAAVEKRLEILKTTGSLPENHHAAVQRAVDAVADRARRAQSRVTFEVGTIAAHARADADALARDVPGVVAGGVARIRAAASAAAARIDAIADRQIRAVIDHVDRAGDGVRDTANETAAEMHRMLMEDAPRVLTDAKAEMDAQLTAHAAAAATRIAGIKTGQEPQPIDNQVPAAPAPADAEAETPSGPTPPSPPTWAQAEAEIAGQLGTDMPENRMTQYGNLRCAGALPGLITPHREAYETANAATIAALTGPDMQRRFFETTMGLIIPAVAEENRNADRVDDTAYIGAFTGALGEEYMQLSADKRAVVRQIDEKRAVLRDETLNPDHDDSIPHSAIKGLREAGEKIEQGLRDQARVIEASLRANLAQLAAQYPDVVARLLPILNTGGFLEATATLGQIAEARQTLGLLEDGQIETVAAQAQQALARAHAGFDQQMASLRKTARKSAGSIDDYAARAHYDLVRTAAAYTGVIDQGVRAALPQIQAHATRTAEQLLGPRQNSRQGFGNIETAAINFLNGVMAGEWGGYVARLAGLEEQLGGVATGALSASDEKRSAFGQIRNGVKTDAVDRAIKVEGAMSPAPMDAGDRVLAYGGGLLLAPFTGGASVAAVVGYDIYSNPNENEITEALALPWPAPPGIDEAQTRLRRRTSLVTLIEQRLTGEGQQADILGLFSADVAVRSASKTNLVAGSDDIGGISGAAALALTRSFTAEELGRDVMPADARRRMSEALAGSLSKPDDREIAAAYLNGQPDQALAIRLRVLFDRQQRQDYNQQLQTGAEMDRLIRAELFAAGPSAHVPQAEMDRLRDAAFLRFDEVSGEGRTRVTVDVHGPRPGAVDTGAVSPTQIRTEGRQQQVYGPPLPPAMTVGYGRTDAAAPAAPQSDDQAARRETDLEAARRSVIAYMNRPRYTYQTQRGNDRIQGNLDRYARQDRRHSARSYDPETGRVSVSPASSIQAYNTALIQHGTTSPQALGARAAATIAWMPTHGTPSTNQINRLNENFTDSNFNQMRLRWEAATPSERLRLRDDWAKAQADHRIFLQAAARGMGMDPDRLNDPAAVQAFVTQRLGDRFAAVDEEHREAGEQIVTRGRIAIDTGMDLAAAGWGTNEQLMHNVMGGRTQAEWSERRADGRTMRQYARDVADSELSGDDWQQALADLRGPDSNDFERAETANFVLDQQLEEGTNWLSSMTMAGTWQRGDMLRRRAEVDDRLMAGMQAGIAEARRRGIDIPDDQIPTSPRGPGGGLHPMVRRFAMDGDGALRGSGPSMDALVGDARQSARHYRAEIDRQEGIFTSIITALAVIASVVALIIPGVNAVAAGILIALLAGAATVAVKSGMRGSRYGWEEAAVDVGSAVIEAATAGVGGALSKGARLGAAARAASAAGDAAEAAMAAQKIAKLGRLGRAGVAMHDKLGPVGASIVQESVSGAVSASANAAMNDRNWDDGMGRGVLRLAGHGLQGAAAAAINVGLTSKVSRGLDARLSPLVADPATVGKLNRIGKALGPGGREMLSEVLGGLSGALASEGINILADLARNPDKMTLRMALERLGKAGLKELVSTGGRTAVQQRHRARASEMSERLMREGRDPTPSEALLLNRLSQSGGLVAPGTPTAEFAARFSAARARIADMPETLRPHLMRMSPLKAMEVVAMMDGGRLGARADRMAFVRSLATETTGLDVVGFDKLLVRANEAHAPARRARKSAIRATHGALLRDVRGPERAALKGLDFSQLVGLSADIQRRFAKGLAAGEDPGALARDLIPDNPGLRARVDAQLRAAATEIAGARAMAASARARIRGDLGAAAPAALRGVIAGLRPRDAAALHKHLRDDSPEGRARAAAVLRAAGLSPGAAAKAVRRMSGTVIEQAARKLYMDNVPPAHRDAMAQLPPDALMEIRVAQFARTPLGEDRIAAILAQVKARRPDADMDALRDAITATMSARHGRPGFRDALAQKRAFLDLVPFGMKRAILRTPIITLPEDAFLAFVRGSGGENAVTLIVNGKPVVLMREGADPRKLAEEGLHVLQHHDPDFRTRLAQLDEARIARWDALPLDERIAVYRQKVDIEIDAQRRMISRLRARAGSALWPGARARARTELRAAEASLAGLTRRRGQVGALTPEARARIEMGLENPPKWLIQPARMFSKDDDVMIARLLPGADDDLATAYRKAAARIEDLPRPERKRLLNVLRMMRGAVPREELLNVLKYVNTKPKDADADLSDVKAGLSDAEVRRLQGLTSADAVDVIQQHLLARSGRGRAAPEVGDLRDLLKGKDFADDPTENKAYRHLFLRTVRALTRHAGDGPELSVAKQALLAALVNQPSQTSNAMIRQQLELAAQALGLGSPTLGVKPIAVLRGRPRVQALVLEALATNKTLLTAKGEPKASQAAFIAAVENIVAGGIARYPAAAQRSVFETLTRAFYSGVDAQTLTEIGNYPAKIAAGLKTADIARARTVLMTSLEFMSRQAPRDYKTIMRKLGPLLTHVVDLRVRGADEAPSAGRVSIGAMNRYIAKAIRNPKFAASLIRLGQRARVAEAQGAPRLSKDDLEALRNTETIATGQKSFLERHEAKLTDPARGQDVNVAREDTVAHVRTLAKAGPHGLELTVKEARAIAKRIEVLDQAALFSVLAGRDTSRKVLLQAFFSEVAAMKLPKGADDETLNKRGKAIEAKFRAFVRELSSAGGKTPNPDRDPPLLGAIAKGDPIVIVVETKNGPQKKTVPLSPAARAEILLIMVRGSEPAAMARLPAHVRAEIETMKTLMVEEYIKRIGSERIPAHDDDVRKALRAMIEDGFLNVEKTAKGAMLEHSVEALMALRGKDVAKGALPDIFDEVSSASDPKIMSFRSIDQTDDKPPRNLDNAMRIGNAPDAPEGMKKGDVFGIDSKNGPGAFSPDQFRRYLVEMLNVPRGKASIFGQGKLAGLIYMADSAAGAVHAHRQVMAVMKQILETAKDGKVRIKIGEAEAVIDADLLRNHAPKLIVAFGRIGQDDGAARLGPFVIEDFESSVASMVKDALGKPSPET